MPACSNPLLLHANTENARAHGMQDHEFKQICKILQRSPNMLELGIVSAMWSEHCSYKSSRLHLKKFPTQNKCVIQGPGENAGIVNIGNGQAAVFKMESHNHPSYIEPFQGAATGVGGILRDIFTMGARPVAIINSLRFGSTKHPKTRSLINGVVSGISHYGNCIGIPTVGGETQFNHAYDNNILVNVMAVGITQINNIFYARGAKPGMPVIYVGAQTGPDGVHGASMASAGFSKKQENKRPTVQVGDPFAGKRLLEACLELMQQKCIVSIQDMGAAGLTSSAAEMADKSQIGIKLSLDNIPTRIPNMNAYDIMLSESQERMLMILKPNTEKLARKIFGKWELDSIHIGYTNNSRQMQLQHHNQNLCNLPISMLVENAPLLDRPLTTIQKTQTSPHIPALKNVLPVLTKLISSPDMCCKQWIWEQYDRHVMTNTIAASSTANNAALVRIHGTQKALALTSDCTPRYVAADPRTGGQQAVAESWRNLICSGAKPLAITNNLNFGNPEIPEIMTQISEAIDGMAETCRILDFPVVSGNVSLYNETDGKNIDPTPVVGGLGLIENIRTLKSLHGPQNGDILLKLGKTTGHLGCSLYLQETGENSGSPPPVNPETEKQHGQWILKNIQRGLFHAVHDISDGGLACAAAEMAIASNIGLELTPPQNKLKPANWYFGEDQGRYLLAVSPESLDRIMQQNNPSHLSQIGKFGGTNIKISSEIIPLTTLANSHKTPLPEYMEGHKIPWQ